MNTPEIQARIERLNREHPPAKGMEWRAVEAGVALRASDFVVGVDELPARCSMATGELVSPPHCPEFPYGFYFRQVPAEAKEEELPGLDYEGELLEILKIAKNSKRWGQMKGRESEWRIGLSQIEQKIEGMLPKAREQKPEPDVEPDENTPRLTEVEFQRSAPGGEWERGHLLYAAPKDSRVGCMVLTSEHQVLSVFRCRLRREGK